MKKFADVKGDLPGPRSRALVERERRLLAPGIQSISTLAGIAVDGGEGALLRDLDGNTFIDFVAGICVASLGHGHPVLGEALLRQASRVSSGSFATEARTELLERIAAEAGKIGAGKLRRTQLYSGGSEAVESALRLARAYTKHYEVLSFWGGFHGKTGGVLGLLGSDFKHGLGPAWHVPGLHLAPYPDSYRGPLGPGATVADYVEFTRQLIKVQTAGSLAAILVEPIQGTAGNVLPPVGWLPALKKLANEHGALLILDEMITGWGRTGKMFGQMHFEVEADILTFGKGVANGFPLTGLVTTDEIVQPERADPWSRPSFSSSSYGGGPLGAAAANAVTRVIVEERLDLHAARVGEVLLGALRVLGDKYPFIGEVRGKGLLLAVELVKDQATRAPLDKRHCEWIFRQCLRRGLITMAYSPRVRLNPPLTITEEQALEGVAILDEVFGELQPQLTS
jgi:4-aminobutyrate aminotransferase/(S)-3-amino-2-methylpropionate transaminase